ncbi:M1-specific T cell receptor alpha chain-like [Sander vitreus]
MIFGSGTKLHVNDNQDLQPSYYKLSAKNTTACLATGFSRNNKAESEFGDIFNNKTPAVRISDDSLYNQVTLLSDDVDEERCDEAENVSVIPCVDILKPDPHVNFVSLIVLGLRLLFLKTIAFNVLLTLRLWISQ